MAGEFDLERVAEFDARLDRALEARPTFACGGTAALRLAANIIEHVEAERPGTSGRLVEGLQVLASSLVGRPTIDEPDVATLFEDLDFGAHYHLVRDYLYYSYNAPGSMSWTLGDHEVRIQFADSSLPRQFYLAANSWFVDSMRAFADKTRSEEIGQLLQGTPEFEITDAGRKAMDLIELEAADKLNVYFNLVADVDVELGGYTSFQLFEVYRALLVKALYHRYHASVNGSRGAIFMTLDDLVRDLAVSSGGMSESACRAAVLAMSYGPDKRDAGVEALYFSLYYLPDRNEVVMLPHHFALWEGYVNLLRLIALRDPALFSREFSGPLGASLTKRMAKVFESVGFQCVTDVRLQRIDHRLPDVDLLVISEERTLGYVVFVCEVKSPLPPRWAKDQLRVLAPDSVAKAFAQLELLDELFASESGIALLRDLLPPGGLPDFDEFALLVNSLVITSDNTGAFFSDRDRRIIDFRTLTRLLRASDGDTLYVLQALGELAAWADSCLEIIPIEVDIGGLAVTYDGVTVKALLDFEQLAFRSADVPNELVKGMLETGDRPLDFLRDEGADT